MCAVPSFLLCFLRTLVVTSTTIGPKPVSLLGIVTTLPATRIGITAPAYLFIKNKNILHIIFLATWQK
jgi:hypothetical protein